MTGIAGITFRRAALELKLPFRTFEIEAARHEHLIGPPARLGQSRILSSEQWQELRRLILAGRAKEAKK
jgi:hypothetical protein